MKAFIIISALCVCWALAAKPEKRHVSQEGKKQEKRVLYDFGTKPNNRLNGNKWSSDLDLGSLKVSTGKGYTEKVITKVVEKKIPVPYTVEKRIPYTVEKKVPYEVRVPVPQPYTVEKKVPYPVKEIIKVPYYVPQPYEVVKKVPYQVVIPVPKPYQVNVSIPKPYIVEKRVPYPVKVAVPQPYTVEKKVPYEVKYEVPVPQPYIVEKKIPYEVKIPVHKPYTVHVPKPYPVTVEKHVPVPVEKPLPYEVKIAIDKPYPVEVLKPVPYKVKVPVPFPYTVEKKVPVQVEKPVAVPVDKPYPVYKEVPVVIEKEIPYTVKTAVHIPIKSSQGNGGHNEQQNQLQQNKHTVEFEQGFTHQSTSVDHGDLHKYHHGGQNRDFAGKVQITSGQYAYQNDGNKENIYSDNSKQQKLIGQNDQYHYSNSNPNVGFVPNNYVLSKPNVENVNYNTEQNQHYGQEQSGKEISTKVNMNFDGPAQLQQLNDHKISYEFQQIGENLNYQQQQGNYYEQNSNEHHNQWQEQKAVAVEEHQGYTYNAPEKSNSLQVESGNHQYQQHGSYVESPQQLIHLGKPQQYTKYETRVNHGTVKTEQPQIDYASYTVAPQSVGLSHEIGGSNQLTQSAGNIGSVGLGQPKQQPTFIESSNQAIGEDGSYGHKVIEGEQYSYTTEAHEQPTYQIGSTQDINKDVSYTYDTIGQQPTYAYGSNEKDNGKFVFYKQETSEQAQHRCKDQEKQQPTYTYEPYSNQAVGQGGSYGHETVGQEQHHSSGSSSRQAAEKGQTYNYEGSNQGQQSYKADENQQPTYHYHIGSSSHQDVEHSGHFEQSQKQYHTQVEQQQQQQPIYIAQDVASHENIDKNQQTGFANFESSNPHSSHASVDQGQNFGDYAGLLTHQSEQQPNYLTNGGAYHKSNQEGEATKQSEYGTNAGGVYKPISSEEEPKVKSWK